MVDFKKNLLLIMTIYNDAIKTYKYSYTEIGKKIFNHFFINILAWIIKLIRPRFSKSLVLFKSRV